MGVLKQCSQVILTSPTTATTSTKPALGTSYHLHTSLIIFFADFRSCLSRKLSKYINEVGPEMD